MFYERGRCQEENKKNHFYGLAICHVIVAKDHVARTVFGRCFNIVVAIGVDVASIHVGFGYRFVYTAREVVGALLAAGLFRVCRPIDFGGEAGLVAKCTTEFLGKRACARCSTPSCCSS